MARPHGNLAAGFRRLGARSHARLLDDQLEALVRIQHADRMLTELLGWIRAQHDELRAAENTIRAANERASTAEYIAPVAAIEAAS